MRLEGQSVLAVHHGSLTLRHGEATPLDDGGDEEEDLHLGQLLTGTSPPARPEGQEPLRQLTVDAPRVVQEAIRVESLRVGEDVLVADDGPEVDEDEGVFGDEEAVEDGVPRTAVWESQGEEAGVSHHLQDHRFCVREAREVFEAWRTCHAHHAANLFVRAVLHVHVRHEEQHGPLEGGGNGVEPSSYQLL